MRVLILSQYYQPEPIPKPSELAHALTERGHIARVVTGFPNYPSGKLYSGFQLGLIQHHKVDGVSVTRTYEFPYHGKHPIGRFLNYFSFMLSAPLGVIGTPAFDVMYVWHPPLTIGVAAWLIARLRHIPFVYDVQDIWPESAVLSGVMREGGLVRAMSRLEKFVYRQANHLLVVTEGARNNLIGKGVAPSKISVMPHWVDEQIFAEKDERARQGVRSKFGWGNRFVILFAGNLGLVQGLETVVASASELRQEPEYLIVFMGDGSDKPRLQSQVESLGLTGQVQFIDAQPQANMPEYMGAADVLLVHLRDSELSQYVIPTKTYAYLAAGQPILMAMRGAAADLVRDANAGLVIPPENPKMLADGIRSLYAKTPAERAALGQRGKQYIVEHFSKQTVLTRYENLLCRVAKENDRG